MILGLVVFRTESLWPGAYGGEPVLPEAGPFQDGIDKAVSMAFSLTLALFVMVGFALREMTQATRLRRFTIVWCAVFLLSAVISFYMAFLARSVAFYYPAFPAASSLTLASRFMALQMLGVAVAGLAAVLLIAEHYLAPKS
jgi:hypothetical protein